MHHVQISFNRSILALIKQEGHVGYTLAAFLKWKIFIYCKATLLNLQGENDSIPSEHFLGTDGEGSYTLFHGHSGPIYSATFSPLGDFLLSSSSDSTSKLSLKC